MRKYCDKEIEIMSFRKLHNKRKAKSRQNIVRQAKIAQRDIQ